MGRKAREICSYGPFFSVDEKELLSISISPRSFGSNSGVLHSVPAMSGRLAQPGGKEGECRYGRYGIIFEIHTYLSPCWSGSIGSLFVEPKKY